MSYVQGGSGRLNVIRRKDLRSVAHKERLRIANHSLRGSGRRRGVYHRIRRKFYQGKVSLEKYVSYVLNG